MSVGEIKISSFFSFTKLDYFSDVAFLRKPLSDMISCSSSTQLTQPTYVCFIMNFIIKLFHFFGFTIQLVFGSSASVTRFIFFRCYLDGSRFSKEPAGIVYHAFEAFCREALELEMLSFVSITLNLFFRVIGFALLLRLFSCFYPHF